MEELRLATTRVLAARPPEVWRLLTEPELLARWWGPAGFTSPSIALDLRPGGRYRIEMQPPEGKAFHLEGEFLEVVPPSRLVSSFRWEEPDPDDVETVVTLTLAAVDRGTELALDQGTFATEARRALHREGWSDALDKLAQLVLAGTR